MTVLPGMEDDSSVYGFTQPHPYSIDSGLSLSRFLVISRFLAHQYKSTGKAIAVTTGSVSALVKVFG